MTEAVDRLFHQRVGRAFGNHVGALPVVAASSMMKKRPASMWPNASDGSQACARGASTGRPWARRCLHGKTGALAKRRMTAVGRHHQFGTDLDLGAVLQRAHADHPLAFVNEIVACVFIFTWKPR